MSDPVPPNARPLAGKVALVTGAGRNIGRAIARALAADGASVVVNARSSRAEAEAVVRAIVDSGGTGIALLADVTDADAVNAMVAAAIERFGRLDLLVNNAALRREAPIERMTVVEWREVFATSVDAAFHCAQACIPHLRASGASAIVNIGGLTAYSGAKQRAHVVAAKAGLGGLTRALAHELAADNHGELRVAGLDRHGPRRQRGARTGASQDHRQRARPARLRRRGGVGRLLPVRTRRTLHHRADAACERRRVDGVSESNA